MFELSDSDLARLRSRLSAVDYTVDGVRRCLGPIAHAALHRNETTPGLRATEALDPLSTLIRLFLLQTEVPAEDAEAALPGLVEPLCAEGVLRDSGAQVAALVDIRPYGSVDATGADREHWVVADLTPGMDGARPEVDGSHVLGVNSAATTLAQLTVREPVGQALDLGTGCGVQVVHLAAHAQRIVATDVNPRALAMARLTTLLEGELDGSRVDVREGSLFEPVEGERFDLIVSNPPFVISPGGSLTYRESGLAGDEICRRLVREAPSHLTEGGVCQLLANWLHVDGSDWTERLAAWVEGLGCDAWVVQREVSDPAEYVELWLKDGGLHGAPGYRQRYEEWLGWLEAQRATGIGFGWITLRRTDAASTPVVRIEDWPHRVVQPLGAEVSRWLQAVGRLRAYDDEALRQLRLTVAPDVHQEQYAEPGAPEPAHIVLKQRAGLCRERPVDTALAGFVGACDGELTAGQIIDALGELLPEAQVDPRDVRELVESGFLHLPAA